jgi:hypothetical protein
MNNNNVSNNNANNNNMINNNNNMVNNNFTNNTNNNNMPNNHYMNNNNQDNKMNKNNIPINTKNNNDKTNNIVQIVFKISAKIYLANKILYGGKAIILSNINVGFLNVSTTFLVPNTNVEKARTNNIKIKAKDTNSVIKLSLSKGIIAISPIIAANTIIILLYLLDNDFNSHLIYLNITKHLQIILF